jgi:modulator of FtsH protease HflK
MAWNAPGDQNSNQKDPWKKGGQNNNSSNEFDKIIEDLTQRFKSINGGGGFESLLSNIPVLLIVALIIWVLSGFYVVNEKERGVVLRFGKYQNIVDPGLRWKLNLIDKVNIINTTEIRSVSHKALVLTEDSNVVEVEISVQYRVIDPKKYWLAIRYPEKTLKDSMESALRHVMGTKQMDSAISSDREAVKIGIDERLQTYLDKYHTGIMIDEINVEDIQPPEEVQDAFDDVEKADQDKQQIVDQAEAYYNKIVPEARGEAKRLLEESYAYKEKIIAESEGESIRFNLLLVEYKKAPKVTRDRLYLEAIGEVMTTTTKVIVDVDGGNNMIYLPLDKMVRNSSVDQTIEKVQEVLPNKIQKSKQPLNRFSGRELRGRN